jgi:hypothetical protein
MSNPTPPQNHSQLSATINEESFWQNYFYKVHLIQQEVGFQPSGPQVSIGKSIFGGAAAGGAQKEKAKAKTEEQEIEDELKVGKVKPNSTRVF